MHDYYKIEDEREKEGEEVFFFVGWVSHEVCFMVVGSISKLTSSSHGVRLESCFFKLFILGQIIRRGEVSCNKYVFGELCF
jgi:hypothetical protein